MRTPSKSLATFLAVGLTAFGGGLALSGQGLLTSVASAAAPDPSMNVGAAIESAHMRFAESFKAAKMRFDERAAKGGDLNAARDGFNSDFNAARNGLNDDLSRAQVRFNDDVNAAAQMMRDQAGSGGGAMGMAASSFRAHLQGDRQVPAVSTPAYGEFSARYDKSKGEIMLDLSAYNLTGVTMAHLHLGAAGENGPVIAPIMLMQTGGTVNGKLAMQTITAADLVGPAMGMSLEEAAVKMKEGKVYVNVHTAGYPGGEIRGQVQMQ